MTLGQAAILALMLVVVGVAVPLAFIRVAPRPLPPLPISNIRVQAPTLRDADVCSGSTHKMTTSYTVKRLATLTTLTSVSPIASKGVLSGTVSSPSYTPLFQTGQASMDSEWTVPFLAPGDYWLLMSFGVQNQESQPGFIYLPFSIAENCKERP